MSATVINGKAIAEEVYKELGTRVAALKAAGTLPRMGIIQVGTDEMSKRYVGLKETAALRLGMECVTYHISGGAPEASVISTIHSLNADPSVHGIIVQMPLPESMDEQRVLDEINPEKDIDGLHFCNAGRLLNGAPAITACTPRAVMRILDDIGLDVSSKNAVVVGRSVLVGRPIALCLLNRSATVSVCHTKTQDLAELTRVADILIVAAGSPKLIKADMVKPGAVVIDIGQTNVDGKLYGDVDFDEVEKKASYITKVTGGVGPMTVAMLMNNLVDCAEHAHKMKALGRADEPNQRGKCE